MNPRLGYLLQASPVGTLIAGILAGESRHGAKIVHSLLDQIQSGQSFQPTPSCGFHRPQHGKGSASSVRPRRRAIGRACRHYRCRKYRHTTLTGSGTRAQAPGTERCCLRRRRNIAAPRPDPDTQCDGPPQYRPGSGRRCCPPCICVASWKSRAASPNSSSSRSSYRPENIKA